MAASSASGTGIASSSPPPPSPSPAARRRLVRLYLRLARPRYDLPYILLLLLLECILCYLIITRVSYTEIDWKAYMQEVEGWLVDGEYDYTKLRGDTGPLVYPAGFLYLYAGLRYIAGGDGRDVRMGQWAFMAIYVVNCGVVLGLYQLVVDERRRRRRRRRSTASSGAPSSSSDGDERKNDEEMATANEVWSLRIAMALLCLSKRIHSIFVLRLFNDAPAMLLFYISAYLFSTHRWRAGCLFYSLGVSIKMNVLLFAPGLLLLLLQSSPNFAEVVLCLGICAGVQLVLGLPFLARYPISYLRKAFEFDRVFFHKWTVNLKFLPEDVFVSKRVSLLLLLLHLSSLAFLANKWLKSAESQTGGRRIFLLRDGAREGSGRRERHRRLSAEYVLVTLFASDFVGVALARTLHYQFYCWYFHALPLLLLPRSSRPSPPQVARMAAAMGAAERAFNVYPATPSSSGLLQLAHLVVLAGVFGEEAPGAFPPPDVEETDKEEEADGPRIGGGGTWGEYRLDAKGEKKSSKRKED